MNGKEAGSVAFLAGGGELGALMRAFDWSATPLGPPEDWPQSLKTAVRIMLTSRQPIWIGWGDELIYLYNDPYKSIIGGKHPAALGQPVSTVWREIWDDISPMLSTAMNGDEGTYVEEQLLIMERNGYPEETYYTFSYSPIPEDGAGGGRAGGIICANSDDTRRVIGERQIALLRELAAGTADARTWREACERSARALASNPRDVPFALIYMADPGGDALSLAATCGIEAGAPTAPVSAALDNTLWPFEEVLRTHEPRVVANPGQAPSRPPRPSRVAVLPIAASGETGRPGVLVAGLNPFRLYDDDYQGFLTLAAGQIAASIGNAHAYEEERKRAETLAELDRAKTAFFSNVSHEFRTPLTLMLGPIEEILARPGQEPGDRELLTLVHRNGLRLQRLVNTLLDFSRIEAGRVQASYEPIDLPAFTAELASTFRSACEKAGLELKVDCPPLPEPVYVDRDMWEKIVLNLVSNAFKFTLEGRIEVSLMESGGKAELTVRDTGAGIPPEEMPKLFDRFHRVEGTPGRTQEGSGIGLALVQELVRLHGGEVRAESELGRGTALFVTLPFGRYHLPAARIGAARTLSLTSVGAAPFVEEALRWVPGTEPEEPPVETSLFPGDVAEASDRGSGGIRGIRPRVLLADDNSDMRDYMSRLLSQGHEVTAVADGLAALRAVREERPDLVLTDVMMPGLDGFGLLRELRSDPATRDLPIIMLSARAGEESRVEGLESGADDYLVKPFSARELQARVGAHLQMARMRRESAKALRESHARFEALVNAAPIGIYFVDEDMRLRQVNPKARPVFGEIEGLIGSDFVEVIHILWPEAYADEIVERFRHTLATGEPQFVSERIEERRDRKVLEYYEWQSHRISLPDGKYGVVCYFTDISRHVLARQALADADRRKDEFLATLAHELRNPLAPIRNMLEIMKRADGNAALIERARATMERQLGHMIRLIDDLLDVSRISQGKVELKRERVELAPVVYQALEACRPLAESARHEVNITLPSEPVYLNADPVRLAQVFGNVLNNACKYTEPGGRIWLQAERRDGDLTVRVKDTGVGIPPDKLDGIFEIFTQVDRTRSQGGLGIGLTLVKRLTEMHGGTVTAHSEGLGRGTEIELCLPVLAGQPSAEPLPEPAAQASTARRILVVDDNRDSALSLALLLEMTGNEVRTAYDGQEALDAAAEFLPDVVLMDLGMPKLDGYEAASRIRAQPWGRRMVLVAVTGWGQKEDRRRTTAAGFDGHLVKPVDHAELVRLLASLQAKEHHPPGDEAYGFMNTTGP